MPCKLTVFSSVFQGFVLYVSHKSVSCHRGGPEKNFVHNWISRPEKEQKPEKDSFDVSVGYCSQPSDKVACLQTFWRLVWNVFSLTAVFFFQSWFTTTMRSWKRRLTYRAGRQMRKANDLTRYLLRTPVFEMFASLHIRWKDNGGNMITH